MSATIFNPTSLPTAPQPFLLPLYPNPSVSPKMRLTSKLMQRKKRGGAADTESTGGTEMAGAKKKSLKLHEKKQSHPCPLLAITPEIRMQIFTLLENIPDHESDEDRQRARQYDGFSKTRKSLLLTCRQLNVEFTPHFYRSTTFCLRHIHHTPRDFFQMVDKLDAVKVKNIRHLEYRNRQYQPTDFAVMDELCRWISCADLHLETLNVVHGDYVSRSILRAPIAMAMSLLDLDRPVPMPNMNWTPFAAARWRFVAPYCYGVHFRIFETDMTEWLMRGATVTRERGKDGFRVFFRREHGVADRLVTNPPEPAPPPEFVGPYGPTLAGVLCPLVPPKLDENGKESPPRRRIRLD